MWKYVLFLLIFCFGIFSKSFESIETLNSIVNEKTYINGQWREKKYYITLVYPNKVYKEILEPKLNLGEKIIYIENYKWVYYPIFDELYKEKLDGEENYILSALKNIKEGIGNKTYEENRIINLDLNKEIKLTFDKYILVDNIEFSTEIRVYEENILIAILCFENLEINKNYNDNLFDIGL